ncbi:hypothetical protein [Vibrio lentus]|uniref:hypothetical protein n=1 Tax=Vibrio lentus TaxID=136468 RepID=UPI001D041F9A|nr:hypothetical protein [Vibrio lentus]MCB5464569.1 hypothetical protein [Vibrio lentus]MCC4849650.1 hypothetical protein [Vibrio lentus]
MFKTRQKTTKIGLGLLAGSAALATGNADIISFDITDSGLQIGGLAELAFSVVTGLAGLVLGLFDEDKEKAK